MKKTCALLFVLVSTWIFACTPQKSRPSSPPSAAGTQESATAKAAATGNADPFTGLLVDDTHLPWSFKHGAGPKPPESGFQKLLAFPRPPAPPTQTAPGPLEVRRMQPTGEIGAAGALTIAFSQPMVPLASLQDTRNLPIPAKLDPAVPGRWRWMGTNLLAFEAENRFPFATHYVVKIPAGTQSQLGGKLAQEAQFAFSTPALALDGSFPYSGDTHARPETVLVLYFNQKIDSAQLLPFVQVLAKGQPIATRPLSRQEFERSEFVKKHSMTWQEGRTLALQPEKPLEKDTPYLITVKRGAPSAEGPRKTTSDLVVSFKTYGPLYVRHVTCGWREEPCRPGYTWEVEFSNPVRTESKDAKKFFKISPSAGDIDIEIGGSYGSITGDFKAATRYTVAIAGDLEDEFGQKLAKPYSGFIQVADAFPELNLPAYRQAVLEASTSRTLPVPATNIVNPARVRLFSISPENVFLALEAASTYASERGPAPGDVLGKPAAVWEMPFNKKKNERETAYIDLDRALQKKNGIVFVEVKAMDLKVSRYDDNIYRQLLVNVTNLGLTVRYDDSSIHALVTGLSDGKPKPGVPVKCFVRAKSGFTKTWEGVTGADGAIQAPGPNASKNFGPMLIVAGGDDDKTFVVLDGSGDDGGYVSSYTIYYTPPPPLRLRAHIFTERDPYRPGETVHITGWLRSETAGPMGKLGMLLYDRAELEWEIRNPQSESVAKGKTSLDKNGAFTVDYTPPSDAMLGQYAFIGTVRGIADIGTPTVGRAFSVLAYRTPEHVVDVSIAPGPYMFGDTVSASISARYTFGSPMRKADANYTLTSQKTSYRPPKNSEFSFGKPPRYFWGCWYRRCAPQTVTLKSDSGQLDDAGFWNLRLPIPVPEGEAKEEPALLTLETDITDVNRQSVSARTTTIVHPASVYTGLRTQRNLVRENEPFNVEGVVAGIDGVRIAGKAVRVRALLRTWKYVPPKKDSSGEDPWQAEDIEKASCTFTSAGQPASCTLKVDRAGFYVLEGVTTDEKGRRAVTQRHLYVAGKDAVSWRQDNQQKIELVLDKEGDYSPGEKAKILVQAPFYPAVGMLTVEREGIVSHRLIEVKSSTHVEEIPVTQEQIPNVHVSVALIRGRVKVERDSNDDPGRPLLASGRVKIPISLDSRRVTIVLKPSKNVIQPGETVELSVQTLDDRKQSVPARLAIMAVDEGVLSLLGFTTPDPMPLFYPERSPQTALEDIRTYLIRKTALTPPASKGKAPGAPRPAVTSNGAGGGGMRNGRGAYKMAKAVAEAAPAPPMEAGMMAGDSVGGEPVSMRTFFATTAYFNNQVRTGADGTAKISMPMPENLTTFRIMAVAMDTSRPDRFGSADSQVTIRKDFMLRAALPRFANYGDTFEAAVVLNTLLEKEGPAEVKISGSNFELLGPDTQTVTLNAREAKEIRFKVRTPTPGKAAFTFVGRFLGQSDGVQAPAIPVHVPVTTETTATYGMTDESVVQPVMPPKNVLPQFGGLDVHLSSTALVNLQDAVRFIVDTDWECSEAIASRLVPLFALREVIPAFGIGSAADEARLKELAESGIAKLLTYQHWNGGFKLFPSSYTTWSFVSAYITWTLLRAREAGFAVPDRTLRDAAQFLVRLMQDNRQEYEWYYSYTAQIYAAWVLTEIQRLGLFTPQQMDAWRLKSHLHRLFKVRKEVGFLARAWLMHAIWRIDDKSGDMVKELAQEIENAVVETASGVHFAEVVTEGAALLMHSQARTDAVILRIFLEMYPQHPLLWKIAKGLMDSRIKGDWGSTQSNAFVLDALSAYFRAVETQTPDFTVNAWYDKLYAGTKKFAGRSMDIVHARIPMKTLLERGAGRLLLGKEGPGKLYFRLGLAYVPADTSLPPESQGLYVKRSYSGMDNDDDVKLIAPGRWRVKAGTTVRVSIHLVAQDRRHFVALEDPFPAGLEGVDMNLKTSAQRPRAKSSGASVGSPSYSWWWFDPTHTEMRDDRFVAYYDRLYAGVYEYAYMARATTIGTFHAPPVRALEMYHPEVFGRGATEIVEVVP